jgi:serine/threonine-protein kinase
LIGRTLGKYRVLERLGSGGMGEVYAALDTTLGRKVALKVLRPEVAGSAERRQRFQREARAVAALNHPNIVTLFSVEEAEGELFLTMELVEGRSLREVLREGFLPLPRVIALASQVCEGLCIAHSAGVLHRDLKPDNLIVTAEDRVKILDFGLAKLLTTASAGDPDAPTVSTPGMTMGTAGYMAPEQALGRKLDARADLFAVGVVLYQMATGRAPFEGETVAALFDHLLNRPPVPPERHNPSLPAAMVAVIARALEKDPDRRYPSARELLEALRRVEPAGPIAPAAEGKAPSSIVVLPFVDLSREKDQEYFCHGVAEELIHSLARVPGLRVISRTSAFAFLGQGAEITEIGRRLRAATALEGSVRKAGNRVRISARLVNTEDGFQLWSKRFDRELEDVFAIEDEIAEAIVSDLARELGGAPPRRAAPRNSGAHDAYLRGIYALNKWSDEWMGRAIASFQDAIALDSGFAPAYAGLAECHLWLYSGVGILPAAEAVPPARAAVEKALELDPRLSEAHRVRGLIAMNHDWDRRGAEEGLRRAIELSPSSAEAALWNAWRLALLEARYEEALAELERAERLGPLDLQVKTQIGYVHYFLHDLDRAIAQFEKALALDATFAFAHYALGDALTQKGDFARAIAEYETSIALGGRSVNHIGVLAYAQGRAGNAEAARALLEELGARAADRHVSPMWMALAHLGLDDREGVFRWLDRACDERDGSLVLVTSAIEFDPLRGDPRFRALLGRMGLGHLAP